MAVKLSAPATDNNVGERAADEQILQIAAQTILQHWEVDSAPLARDVDTVAHHRHLSEEKYCEHNSSISLSHLAKEGELVVGKKSIGFVHEKIPPDKLLESPVLALDKPEPDSTKCSYEDKFNEKIPVGPLTFHGLGLFFLGVQNAELELGSYFGLVARD